MLVTRVPKAAGSPTQWTDASAHSLSVHTYSTSHNHTFVLNHSYSRQLHLAHHDDVTRIDQRVGWAALGFANLDSRDDRTRRPCLEWVLESEKSFCAWSVLTSRPRSHGIDSGLRWLIESDA